MGSNKNLLGLIIISFLIPAIILVGQAQASADELALPSTAAKIEVFDSTQAYFDTKLTVYESGFDVSNKTYLGWCIDQSAPMERSPTNHSVYLYSSLNAPAILAEQEWDKVNYILNHKQGEPQDIQDAIWHFINLNGGYTTESTMAEAMINDADANGDGFIPNDANPILAVICNPTTPIVGDPEVQISIIEVTIPQSNTGPTPTPTGTQPTPTPTSTPNSSPTPTPTPGQTSPTPSPTDNGSEDTTGTLENDAVTAAAIILAAAVIGIVVTFLILRRKART